MTTIFNHSFFCIGSEIRITNGINHCKTCGHTWKIDGMCIHRISDEEHKQCPCGILSGICPISPSIIAESDLEVALIFDNFVQQFNTSREFRLDFVRRAVTIKNSQYRDLYRFTYIIHRLLLIFLCVYFYNVDFIYNEYYHIIYYFNNYNY